MLFCSLFCLFAFVVESKAQTQFFVIDGIIKDMDKRVVLMIELDKDSLMILVGKGNEIGGELGVKYKIEKAMAGEGNNKKGVSFLLNDYFGNEGTNLILVFANEIFWTTQNKFKNDEIISITNLRDEEGALLILLNYIVQ